MKGLYRAIDKSVENNRKLREIVEQSCEILQKTKAETSDQNQSMRIVFADGDNVSDQCVGVIK